MSKNKYAPRLNLSKSLFIRGMQCFKSLWLYKYDRDHQKPVSQSLQILFNEGKKAGEFAQQLFPSGIDVTKFADSIPHRLSLTRELISKSQPVIYEATFQYKGVLVMVDILRLTRNGWEIYEVKSSTGVKPIYYQDIAIQWFVLKGFGVPLSKAFLVHINNLYKRKASISIYKLFKKINVTKKIKKKQDDVCQSLEEMKVMLRTDSVPDITIGPQCLKPFQCDFYDYCWHTVSPHSIFSLSGMNFKKKFELYHQGIVDVATIPADYSLTRHQQIQYQVVKKKTPYVDRARLALFLDKIYYPLCFLDFESYQSAIPKYKNMKPFQQIPIQFSLHILNSPFDIEVHSDFIATNQKDPRRAFAKALIQAIPENSCIIAYNTAFEKKMIKQLAELFPKYEKPLMKIYYRFVDLMDPFENWIVYFSEMKGSHSIKNVLPALVPHMSYEHLFISNGEDAARYYQKLIQTRDLEEKKKIKQALLDYCQLDTLAMVKIFQVLEDLV